jgi:Eukaryotic cytochrome b561
MELRHDGTHDEESDGPWITSEVVMCLHGMLMVVAWAFCVNIGSAAGRYLRKAPVAYPNWFPLHYILMSVGAALSLSSFILIICHMGYGGDEHFDGVHQVLGLIVMIALLVQVLLGLAAHYTWHEGKATCWIDQWHWWIGRGTYLLALCNIITGFMLLSEEGAEPNGLLWFFVSALFTVIFLMTAGFEIHCFDESAAAGHGDGVLSSSSSSKRRRGDFARLDEDDDDVVAERRDIDADDASLADSDELADVVAAPGSFDHVHDPAVLSARTDKNALYWRWLITYIVLVGLLTLAISIGLFTCLNHADMSDDDEDDHHDHEDQD